MKWELSERDKKSKDKLRGFIQPYPIVNMSECQYPTINIDIVFMILLIDHTFGRRHIARVPLFGL